MKVEDLLKKCEASEQGILKTGKFSIIIPGYRKGERCRVAPGLTGQFLSHVGGGEQPEGTLVLLESSKVRKWIEKNNLLPTQQTPPDQPSI